MTINVTLNNLANLQNETTAVATINANNTATTTAFASALNTAGDKMQGTLDMNAQPLINLPAPLNNTSPVRLQDLTGTITTSNAATGTSGHVVPFLDGNNTWSGTNTYGAASTFNGAATFNGAVTFPGNFSNTWGGKQTYNNDVYFKTRPWVDVIAYGADPTGNTDSVTAINNAITSLAATGGCVFFPQGIYKVSASITCNVRGVWLKGSGRLSTQIISTSTTLDVISITADYNEVTDVNISAGNNNQVCTSGYGVHILNAQDCRIQDVIIADVNGAILLDNSTSTFVQFVKTYNIYGRFNCFSNNGGGDQIIANQFDPVFWGTFSQGIGTGAAWASNTNYSTNAVVSSNGGYFIAQTGGTSSSTGSGPVISPFNTLITDGTVEWLFVGASNSAGVYCSNANSNFIAFNDISGPFTTAIFIIQSDGTQIIGNTMGANLGIGIQLSTSATNTLIQGNVISLFYGQFAQCIADTTANHSATGTRIIGNYIQQAGWIGININSNNTLISNNYITGNGLVTGAYAILINPGIQNFIINGNLIIPSVGQIGPLNIATGASDFYNVTNNIIVGVSIVDGGSGTHKTLTGNN